MPGDGRWRLPDLVHPNPVSRDTGHQHDRLGIGRQAQGLFGSVVDQGREVFAQGSRSFVQDLLHHRMRTPGVEHADRLGALSRKNKCKWLHEKWMRKIQKNYIVSNTAPQAKPPPTPSSKTVCPG